MDSLIIAIAGLVTAVLGGGTAMYKIKLDLHKVNQDSISKLVDTIVISSDREREQVTQPMLAHLAQLVQAMDHVKIGQQEVHTKVDALREDFNNLADKVGALTYKQRDQEHALIGIIEEKTN